jgi:hypothetical protein
VFRVFVHYGKQVVNLLVSLEDFVGAAARTAGARTPTERLGGFAI